MPRSANCSDATPQPEFMTLNARYLIAEGAPLDALAEDVDCLFESGLAVFEDRFEDLDSAQWAGVYCLRQALAVFREYSHRVRAELNSRGGHHE